ncbi:hypothetical protein [Nocardia aurantiaca]|uniref:Uncharacterized protein n=1 Tax=Nocardia aurantiaca TaxID=2675850 RepID=A0A6I3KZA7_9NOCA|nr:hypothetical protein [Nocardia aurantiaca]MTE13765.1 hypothetical protein [Nocardia aurantiaca]
MTTNFPAGSDLDHAEQHILADRRDDDIGLDTGVLRPPVEHARRVLDSADLADRIEQAWIAPHHDDDYDCLAC